MLNAKQQAAPAKTRPYIIVIGNEKGGAGKSTMAIHIAIALIKQGFSVGAVDLDVRQRSFGRYLDNRRKWAEASGADLKMPQEVIVEPSKLRDLDAAEEEEAERWAGALETLSGNDVILIDTPGGVTHLSRLAHAMADIVVTPINDSFIDFDLLGQVDPESMKVTKPSIYSEMIWESRMRKSAQDKEKRALDWVVVRNRMSMLDAHNKRRVGEGVAELSKRIGFRVAPGVCERVIYRELFPRGLTLLDMGDGTGQKISMSHISARQEVRDLLTALNLPILEGETLKF